MRKLFLCLLFLIGIQTISAQEVYNLDKPKTEKELIGKAEATFNTAIYQKMTYPVYKTAKGKLFIVYINKKGFPAKKYIN
jgi:hypothetical protein